MLWEAHFIETLSYEPKLNWKLLHALNHKCKVSITTLLKTSSHQALKESINQFTVVSFGIRHKTIAFILVSLNNARPEDLIPNLLLLSVHKRNALTFTRGCRFGFPLSKFLHEDCISRCTSGSRRQAFATPTKWRPTATEAAPTASAHTAS